MAPAIAAPHPEIEETRPKPGQSNLRKTLIILAIVIVVALVAGAIVLIRKWRFTQSQVVENLKEAGDSQVQIRSFRPTFFPRPGCVIEGLIFHHDAGETKPLITIEKLTIQSSYPSLLAQRLTRITAEGMVISIPPLDTHTKFRTSKSEIETDEIVANGAVVEFGSSEPGKKPLRFDIHEALLKNVGWKGPMTYRVKVHNPEPPGEVSAEGRFGVWNQTNAGETPISGKYKFEQADLSVYQGIAGTLDSTGSFEGKLAHIDISGATHTPNFVVTESKHPVSLTTKFSAYVDATKGDTFLEQVDADFWQTHVVAQGSVAAYPGRDGKTALIDIHTTKAHIQDLLMLFVQANRAPMSGSVALQAHVEIPPGENFLKKVKLHGNFGIASGTFKPSTQKAVDELSAGARGEKNKEKEDPATVLSGLKGQVNLASGTANFSDLSFDVPGAAARMHGTYNLINYKIDLHGQMRVDSKISNTATGGKAFLLKMMEPFFKKKRQGEIVPVRISGTYDHPSFGLDINDDKAQKVADP